MLKAQYHSREKVTVLNASEARMEDRSKVGREISRFSAFLVIGGTSTVLNLLIVFGLTTAPVVHMQYLPAAIIAGETGIIYSFILNDRLTFRALANSAGSWYGRLVRFNGAYLAGTLITLVIGYSLVRFASLLPVVAQAIAVVIVLFFNFASVRFWAYRSRH